MSHTDTALVGESAVTCEQQGGQQQQQQRWERPLSEAVGFVDFVDSSVHVTPAGCGQEPSNTQT